MTVINRSVPSKFTQLTDTPKDYTGEAGKVVAVKSTEDGVEFVSQGDAPYSGTGKYSDRFNEVVTATTVIEAIDEIFQFTSMPPSSTLSLAPSSTREKGNTLASITITSNFSMGSNPSSPIASLVINRGATVLETTLAPTSPHSFVETTPVTDTTIFSSVVTDAASRMSSSSATINFLYPVLHMVGAVGLTTAQIYAGATKILSSSKSRTLTFSPINQVVYYAIPTGLGALTSIKDINLFETFPSDWLLRSETITGLDGSSQAYRVYEFKNLTSASATYIFA